MPIGNAPCSWGIHYARDARYDAATYLDEVAAAGYAGTELGPWGFLPTDASQLGDMLDARGLKLLGAAHVHTLPQPDTMPKLMATLREIAPLLAALKAPELVLMDEGNTYDRDTQGKVDAEGWASLVAMVREAQALLAGEFGVRLTFHPHIGTPVETEAQIDRLLEDTDVSLCFDVGHHAVWGQDPVAYMDRIAGRIGYMHLKNVDGAVRDRLLAGALHVQDSYNAGIFCPLHDGVVDIGAVLAKLDAMSFAGPIVVEQDVSETATEPPLVLARRNAEWLGTLKA